MTDGRCEQTATQKLEVNVGGEWIEYNETNADQMAYITSFVPSLADPVFTFQMNKEQYATLFSGAAETIIYVRIVTHDPKSESSLATATDAFKIEVSLGCMDDRIVAPTTLPQVDMIMKDGSVVSNDVTISLSNYESEDPNCRAYTGITVELESPSTGEYVSATDDATRLFYLPVDLTAETLTVKDPSFTETETFLNVRVTYRTGAQAAGIDTREPESRVFQVRFVQHGHEYCRNNVLQAAETAPVIYYVLGSGDQTVEPRFINEVGAALCPTTFTLEA
jgi:hypothetical protein